MCLARASAQHALPKLPDLATDPALTAILKPLLPLADELVLADGSIVRATPFAAFPGAPPFAQPVTLTPADKPGEAVQLPGSDVRQIRFVETRLLAAAAPLVTASEAQSLPAAEALLAAALRWHLSQRAHAPLGRNPWISLERKLADKLEETRAKLLAGLAENANTDGDWRAVEDRIAAWLPGAADGGPLRDAILKQWVLRGENRLMEGDAPAARAILDRIERTWSHAAAANPLREKLQKRAEELVKEAAALPPGKSTGLLREALKLWPGLEGARLEVERRHQPKPLVVAARHLPDWLSPELAWTDVEKQALDLVFEGLYASRTDPEGSRDVPRLAAGWPELREGTYHVALPHDGTWPDGEPITALDVRHTVQLLGRGQDAWVWREWLEPPRFSGDPFRLRFPMRQGLWSSTAALRFYVHPAQVRGKPLAAIDDVDFAKAPFGSGPYRYLGHKKEGARTHVLFQLNAHNATVRREAAPGNAPWEVHVTAWQDPAKDLTPLPHLLLDVPGHQLEQVKKLGFREVRSLPNRRVWFLAVNHRVKSLQNVQLRRSLALAIDRDKILATHLLGGAAGAPHAAILNGPFPANSWAVCPPPRVPASLHQPELAKALAAEAGKQLGKIQLSLKHPDDDPGWKGACMAIQEQIDAIFTEAGMDIELRLVPLGPRAMQKAIRERDYELALHHHDFADDRFELWPLFDPHPDAVRLGGSNFLGYDGDATLQSLLRAAMSHRQFSAVRDGQHSLHAHLNEKMPLIPLWQLPTNVAIHPSLDTGVLDAHHLFGGVRSWTWKP